MKRVLKTGISREDLEEVVEDPIAMIVVTMIGEEAEVGLWRIVDKVMVGNKGVLEKEARKTMIL